VVALRSSSWNGVVDQGNSLLVQTQCVSSLASLASFETDKHRYPIRESILIVSSALSVISWAVSVSVINRIIESRTPTHAMGMLIVRLVCRRLGRVAVPRRTSAVMTTVPIVAITKDVPQAPSNDPVVPRTVVRHGSIVPHSCIR